MKTSLLLILLFSFSLTVFLNHDLFSQKPPERHSLPKYIFKEGKFFFYNPSFSKDSVHLSGNKQKQALSPPCYKCSSARPSVKSIVTSGPIILYITSQNATCGYGSGTILIEAANGTAPYTYSVDGFSSGNGYFPVEGSGVHTIIVTDATGTNTTTTVTLTDIFPGPVLVPFTILSYPSNCSVSDGAVQLNPFGGTPPYQYSMDLINFQTGNVFSNLYSGFYSFYVRDANGCIGIGTVVVYAGQCDGTGGSLAGYVCGNSGIVSISDLNALNNGPFLYSMDGINYQNTGDFANLGAGIHQFYIKDKNGKVQIMGFNEAENCQIAIQYIAVSAACMQNDGSMTVTAANGVAPYTYTIDGVNFQNSNTFNGLAPGNYFITVQDASGVKTSLPAVVYDRCPVVRAVASGETCAGNDGVITAAGFKGTQPYQYSIDGVNFQANNSFPGLKAGTYTITIKDALGFTSTVQQPVNNGCLSASVVFTPSVCGKSNGSLTITALNGTMPYSYSIDGIIFQPGNVFSNLAAGPYTVFVRDVNGIVGSTNIIITNIQGPQINAVAGAASCLNNDGMITATANGGAVPYQYSIDGTNFQNINIFTGLDTGLKTVFVMDGNACSSSFNVAIPLTNNLVVDAGSDITICEGKNGMLNASSNGNSFSWVPAATLSNAGALTPMASPASTTKFYLTSKWGICSKIDSASVLVNPAPIANAGADTSTCYGKNIQLQGSGGINYSWYPDTYLDNAGISNPTLTNPSNTVTYNLNVTDANGCSSILPASVTVLVTPAAKVFAGKDTSVLINQPLQLHALDVNNSGFDNFLWSPSAGLSDPYSQNPSVRITQDITYIVTASTADGCKGEGSVTIKVFAASDIFVPNAFTPNGDGRNDILKPIPIGVKEFKSFDIYNRWGQHIFSTKNPGQGWDGTINGQPQNTGTYVWMTEGIDFKGNIIQKKGTVVLIR